MYLFSKPTAISYISSTGDKIYPVVVDIKQGIKSSETISFMSADANTGILSVAFVENDNVYSVRGTTVVCSLALPDGTGLELPADIVESNIVEVQLGEVGTSQVGDYVLDFKIYRGSDKIIGTPLLTYTVGESLSVDGDVEIDDRFPILTNLILDVRQLEQSCTDIKNEIVDTLPSVVQEMKDDISEYQANKNQELDEYKESKDVQVNHVIDKLGNYSDRIVSIENKNRVQDAYIKGLFNENSDGRITIEGAGNELKLEGSTVGLATVDNVVGDTLVNLWNGEFGAEVKATDCGIKPLTTYTVICHFEQKLTQVNYFLFNGELTDNHTAIQGIQSNPFNGTIVIKITTNSDTTNIGFYKTNSVNNPDLVAKFVILEGDYTDTLVPQQAFEGLQSTFEDGLVTDEQDINYGKYKIDMKIKGKNLINKFDEGFTMNGITTRFENDVMVVNGNVTGTVDIYYTPRNYVDGKYNIPIKRNTDYTISIHEVSGTTNYNKQICYRLSKRDGTSLWGNSYTGVFNSQDYDYISCISYHSSNTDVYFNDYRVKFMLEENTQATSYEPYYERTETLYLNSPLLKGDELVCREDGVYHIHNKNKVILCGSNNEQWLNYTKPNVYFLKSYINDISLKYNPIIATNFVYKQYCWDNTINNTISNHPTLQNIYIYKEGFNDVLEFTQWLQANPTTVVYGIAEPYEEKVSDDRFILEIPNIASLSLNTTIPCQNIKSTYTGNVPSIYSMEKSILDIEQHNVDMVATTWDMDYRLLEVEWVLEDIGLASVSLANVFNLSNRGGIQTMALSRYEQAKIMILGGTYNREVLEKQLSRYMQKGLITPGEYEELIALMEAKDLVVG